MPRQATAFGLEVHSREVRVPVGYEHPLGPHDEPSLLEADGLRPDAILAFWKAIRADREERAIVQRAHAERGAIHVGDHDDIGGQLVRTDPQGHVARSAKPGDQPLLEF